MEWLAAEWDRGAEAPALPSARSELMGGRAFGQEEDSENLKNIGKMRFPEGYEAGEYAFRTVIQEKTTVVC